MYWTPDVSKNLVRGLGFRLDLGKCSVVVTGALNNLGHPVAQ